MDIIIELLLLISAMIWILSGLFVVFLMSVSDKSKGENYKGAYWIKNRGYPFWTIVLAVIASPITLLIGIFVMWDYFSEF